MPHLGRYLVLGSIKKKQAEHASRRKPRSNLPPCPLLQFLSPGQDLSSWPGFSRWWTVTPSSPSCFGSQCLLQQQKQSKNNTLLLSCISDPWEWTFTIQTGFSISVISFSISGTAGWCLSSSQKRFQHLQCHNLSRSRIAALTPVTWDKGWKEWEHSNLLIGTVKRWWRFWFIFFIFQRMVTVLYRLFKPRGKNHAPLKYRGNYLL